MQNTKKIIIFGYGDLGARVSAINNSKQFEVYGVSRNPSKENQNIFHWDWNSDQPFPDELLGISWDSAVLILKPTSFDETGYHHGYCYGLSNLIAKIWEASFKKAIFISSTRVYGSQQNPINSNTIPNPEDFRGKKLLEAEGIAKNYFGEKLVVMRFSGLHTDKPDDLKITPQSSLQTLQSLNVNRISRSDAAKLILKVCLDTSISDISLICSDPTVNYRNYFERRFPEYKFSDSFNYKEQGKIFSTEALFRLP
ncbi:MAG: hypothetical protein ACO397_02050 [Gammaproteobacteria bacterium]|jgi:hypothetical protein